MSIIREFALYKGEELIAFGTRKELAELIGVKESSIKFYGSPTYQKRVDGRGWAVVEITGWDKEDEKY